MDDRAAAYDQTFVPLGLGRSPHSLVNGILHTSSDECLICSCHMLPQAQRTGSDEICHVARPGTGRVTTEAYTQLELTAAAPIVPSNTNNWFSSSPSFPNVQHFT